MTDGNIQVFEGQFVADNMERVAREGGAAVQRIWRQLDEEGWFD